MHLESIREVLTHSVFSFLIALSACSRCSFSACFLPVAICHSVTVPQCHFDLVGFFLPIPITFPISTYFSPYSQSWHLYGFVLPPSSSLFSKPMFHFYKILSYRSKSIVISLPPPGVLDLKGFSFCFISHEQPEWRRKGYPLVTPGDPLPDLLTPHSPETQV